MFAGVLATPLVNIVTDAPIHDKMLKEESQMSKKNV